MAIFKTSLAGVLAVALCSTPLMAQAWEKDRTYKFTVLHTNDHHGRFWPNAHDEYGLAAQKTMMDQIRNEVQTHGGATLILSGGISIPAYRSPICRMRNRIFAQ